MLKDTKSDKGDKRRRAAAQSGGFLAGAEHKEEQYHKRHKGKVGAGMKPATMVIRIMKSLALRRYCRLR